MKLKEIKLLIMELLKKVSCQKKKNT